MIPDRKHDYPFGEQPPVKNMVCIGCGEQHTIKGQWNSDTGRWLIAFNCKRCECHQEMFVSRVKAADTAPKKNTAY